MDELHKDFKRKCGNGHDLSVKCYYVHVIIINKVGSLLSSKHYYCCCRHFYIGAIQFLLKFYLNLLVKIAEIWEKVWNVRSSVGSSPVELKPF